MKLIDRELEILKGLFLKVLISQMLGALISKQIFLPKTELQAEARDTKINPKTKRTELNLFNFSENLKEQTLKMAFQMQILKEYLKISWSDLLELGSKNQLRLLFLEEELTMTITDSNNNLELQSEYSKA